MTGTEARALADVNEISLGLAACQAPLNGGVRMGRRHIAACTTANVAGVTTCRYW